MTRLSPGIVFGLACRIALSSTRACLAPLLPVLLAVAAVPMQCRADGALHARRTLYACSDRRATRTMHDSVPARDADAARIAAARAGCFLVAPDQTWEAIAWRDGLLLARRTPAAPGEPPLFFRRDDLTAASSPAAIAGADAAHGYHRVDDKVWAVMLLAVLVASFRLLRVPWRRLRGRRGSGGSAERRRALALAGAEIEAQRTRLRLRRLQLVIPDPYGSRDLDRWTREKAYFCRSRIVRSLTAHGLAGQWPGIAREVDRRIERAASPAAIGWRRRLVRPRARGERAGARIDSGPARFDPGMDPVDYERHCALLLRQAGWEAEVTVASGDQGTDVLARRGRRSLVLQCKLYSKPVGNSAVQQIAAARMHHRADFAAVVSNADFTRRARELAATNGVYLLHHEELRDFSPTG